MNRRGISTIALAVGAFAVVAIVAMVAYAAGAASGGGVRLGRMGELGPFVFGGFGGWGWSFGPLVMILLVVALVWAAVTLFRRDDRPAPRQGPPVWPPQAPPPGSFEAFEAWHRQAHGEETSTHPGTGPASEQPPGTGSSAAPNG